jgi:hypothetical protein
VSTAALPYEINLYGPPSPLPPRAPSWTLTAGSLAVTILTVIVESSLLVNANPTFVPEVFLLLVLISVLEFYAFWYLTLRLTGGGLSPTVPLFFGPFVMLRFKFVTEGGRRADREEISASRRLRRGAITRQEYEQIVAYRHFVHNEISREEYHAILSFLDYRPRPQVPVAAS